MMKVYPLVASVLLFGSVHEQTPVDYSIQLSATTQVSPPQIKVNWKKIAGISSYTVYKKTKMATGFGTALATLTATDSFYTDNAVVADSTYEYQVLGGSTASGYMFASIKAPAIHKRGTLLLLVDSTFSDSCSAEIKTLMNDIRGDGWKVIRKTFLRTETVPNVKSYITSSYTADNSIKAILLLGHIPVPYSGNLNPDGHPDHQGAWPADCYYADRDGIWSDASVNNTVASRAQNKNIPGDGKYDQTTIPSDVDFQISRIDFANMPAFSKTEIQMMKTYLNRSHSYKVDSLAMLHRAVIDDNFALSTGEPFAANSWRNFSPLIGNANSQSADYITSLNTGTYQWSYGCGGGSYTSASGVGNTSNIAANNINGIFTMLFGSYFGDWDAQNNFLRAPLCANIPALTNCWAGRPHWFFHHMALGENIGYSTMISQNNDGIIYQAVNNYGTRMVHIALMGDLTLRQDYIKIASAISVTDNTPAGAKISWTASPDPAVTGYYVYRSDEEYGSYKLRSGLINVTNYTDSFGTAGNKYYMVRAAKTQNTPSGSYTNLSLGIVLGPTNISSYAHPDTFPASNQQVLYADAKVIAYPNPAGNTIYFNITAASNFDLGIAIYDEIGRLVITQAKELKAAQNIIPVDISRLPIGVYYSKISFGNNVKYIKLVKSITTP
jgi:hypothetical protein